jgi:hypothetical protein
MAVHLVVGAVLYANDKTILLTDRTLFEAPVGMHLPHFRTGVTLVIEYKIVEGRNVLTHVPTLCSRISGCDRTQAGA